MTPAAERDDFERALAVFDTQGVEISGHRAAMWEATWQTTERGQIVELPVHWSLDDWEQYAFLPAPQIGSVIESPRKALELWRAELDGMRHYRCLFNLCCHPFLSGRPGRMLALRELVEYALRCGDVRFARFRDVARAALADSELAPRTPSRPRRAPMSTPEAADLRRLARG